MPSYGLYQSSPPADEPLALPEAQKHCRALGEQDAGYLSALIVAARNYVEQRTGRQLVTATWHYSFDRFPRGREPIELPKGNLQSVTAITYTDTAGSTQTLSTDVYQVNLRREPATITLKWGQFWPLTQYVAGAVDVQFVCGYGAATAVPTLIKQAMLLLIESWYINRADVVVGVPVPTMKLPRAADDLLQMYDLGDEFTQYACPDPQSQYYGLAGYRGTDN